MPIYLANTEKSYRWFLLSILSYLAVIWLEKPRFFIPFFHVSYFLFKSHNIFIAPQKSTSYIRYFKTLFRHVISEETPAPQMIRPHAFFLIVLPLEIVTKLDLCNGALTRSSNSLPITDHGGLNTKTQVILRVKLERPIQQSSLQTNRCLPTVSISMLHLSIVYIRSIHLRHSIPLIPYRL